ncbi:GIY-YIG nuclease family protein [Methylosoma difficile]
MSIQDKLNELQSQLNQITERQKKANWLNHEFNIYPKDSKWNDASGIYIFTYLNKSTGKWVPLYIGQASSFSERFSNHVQWDKAVSLGMAHIHAKNIGKQEERDAIEQELISAFQPPLNSRLK